MNTQQKFLELKNELQKNATSEQHITLSQMYSVFLDFGTEKFTEGLHKGSEIVKNAYNL